MKAQVTGQLSEQVKYDATPTNHLTSAITAGHQTLTGERSAGVELRLPPFTERQPPKDQVVSLPPVTPADHELGEIGRPPIEGRTRDPVDFDRICRTSEPRETDLADPAQELPKPPSPTFTESQICTAVAEGGQQVPKRCSTHPVVVGPSIDREVRVGTPPCAEPAVPDVQDRIEPDHLPSAIPFRVLQVDLLFAFPHPAFQRLPRLDPHEALTGQFLRQPPTGNTDHLGWLIERAEQGRHARRVGFGRRVHDRIIPPGSSPFSIGRQPRTGSDGVNPGHRSRGGNVSTTTPLTRSFFSPGNGPDHRPLDLDWVRELRDRCVGLPTAMFFKQVGGPTPKAGGRLLDGRTWDEYPREAGRG